MFSFLAIVFSIIGKFFSFCAKILYRIISFAGLQYVYLFLIACLILELSGGYRFTENKAVFWWGLGVAALLSFLLEFARLKRRQAIKRQKAEEHAPAEKVVKEKKVKAEKKPADDDGVKIYRSREDKNYFIYEYPDRIEYFIKRDGELVFLTSQPKDQSGD